MRGEDGIGDGGLSRSRNAAEHENELGGGDGGGRHHTAKDASYSQRGD